MKTHWLSGFVRYLDRQAPILEIEGYGQSRRINDSAWPYASKEIRCYRAIHFYVERGLVNHDGPVSQVLKAIHDFQKGRDRGDYSAYFYPFGFTEDNLSRRKTRQFYPHTRMSDFGKGICDLSGSKESDRPATIRVLGLIGNEDFQVFFCTDRTVSLATNVAFRYGRTKERCGWFFLDGKQPEWEPGTRFRPTITEEADVATESA